MIKIGKNIINSNSQVYFIADIAANHDGSLKRAKKLIKLCAIAGANAAKFQHFKADTIVNSYQFDKMKKSSHQKNWKKSVYQVYRDASINNRWNEELKNECNKYGIDFLTSPYDIDYVDEVDNYIAAFKIGSGDITWKEIIIKIAKKNKPVILATGASEMEEVKKAVKLIRKYNNKLALLQCNTNYENLETNLNHLNLNVINTYKNYFGNNIILGLSDHTKGHLSVLGAVSLGAKIIEKHFTDNNNRMGPDHKFSMNPKTWSKMVSETRLLEKTLGNGKKKIEKNETKSVIVQRRSVYAKVNLKKNQIIKEENLISLRPCPKKSFSPWEINKIVGRKTKKNIKKGELIKKNWII